MADIRFYHTVRQSVEQVLPSLVLRALQNGHRIVIKAAGSDEVARVNDYLWTFDLPSFIPHGSAKDGNESDHPVWITERDENPNGADTLILLQGGEAAQTEGFSLVCAMLDGRDDVAVRSARERWVFYKEAGHDLTYWQQGEKGWEKK
ncbi:MAG: DNA polymerase III subunit chi [Alphaproteobacteria bacterium]|nr:DNA polymerase III subunit chi [Alphaproteobacteria bacterium]